MANPDLATKVERIWNKTRWVGDCLIFEGALAKGYGRLGYYAGPGKQVVEQTHRLVWESVHGPIPDDQTIDHVADRCGNRACQNVEHMEVVSRGENARRGADFNSTVISNRAKTHCPKGHPYDEENTYSPPSGGRFCRECGRAATKAWRTANLERENAKARRKYAEASA